MQNFGFRQFFSVFSFRRPNIPLPNDSPHQKASDAPKISSIGWNFGTFTFEKLYRLAREGQPKGPQEGPKGREGPQRDTRGGPKGPKRGGGRALKGPPGAGRALKGPPGEP